MNVNREDGPPLPNLPNEQLEKGKPTHVPRLALKTDEDRKKFEEGKIRMEKRLMNRKKSD